MENTSITCPPVIRDVILFLQKWGMWTDVQIHHENVLYISKTRKNFEKSVAGMQDVFFAYCEPLFTEKRKKSLARLGMMEFPDLILTTGGPLTILMRYKIYEGDRDKLSPEQLQVVDREDAREIIVKEFRDLLLSYGYRFSWDLYYEIEVYKICKSEVANKMKPELEKQLADEFPFMRPRKSYEEQKAEGMITDPYSAFGCECSDGWYELLRSLCAEIMEVYRKHGQPIDIIVDQVRARWGTLRFYYRFGGDTQALHTIGYTGGGSIRLEQSEIEIRSEIAAIVRKWEGKSGEVCEHCGAPGSLRKDPRESTLCDNCWEKSKEVGKKETSSHKKEEMQ